MLFKQQVAAELDALLSKIDHVVSNKQLPSISADDSSKIDRCSILCDLLSFLLYLEFLFSALPTSSDIPDAYQSTRTLPSPTSTSWPYTQLSTNSLRQKNYSQVYEYENSITDCQANHIMQHFSSLSQRINESIQTAYETSFTQTRMKQQDEDIVSCDYNDSLKYAISKQLEKRFGKN